MWGLAAAGIGLVGAIGGSMISSDAAGDAADTQAASAQAGINAQTAQQEKIQALLAPYTTGGWSSLEAQKNLLGLNGYDQQLSAINGIKNGAQFTELKKAGEDSILQNASATGGLRGGNTQAALAQFSPALLNSLINDQYTKLGGLTSIGENAAAQTGNMGMQSANSVSALLAAQGRAEAGGILGSANAINSGINSGISALSTGFGTRNLNNNSIFGGTDFSIPEWNPNIDITQGIQGGSAYDPSYY